VIKLQTITFRDVPFVRKQVNKVPECPRRFKCQLEGT